MRQPDDYNPTPFFKERRSRSGLQTSRFGGRREREPVRQSPPCFMQVIHAGPAWRDFFQTLHICGHGETRGRFFIQRRRFGGAVDSRQSSVVSSAALRAAIVPHLPRPIDSGCALPSAPSRSLIDTTSAGFLYIPICSRRQSGGY